MSTSVETKETTDSVQPTEEDWTRCNLMKYLFVMNATAKGDLDSFWTFSRTDGKYSPNFEFDGKTFSGSDDNGIYEYFYGTIDDFNANYDIIDDDDEAWESEDIRVCLPRTNDIDIRNMQQIVPPEDDLLHDSRIYFNLSLSDTEEAEYQEKEIYMPVHIDSGTLVLSVSDYDPEEDSLTVWLQWAHKRYKQQYAKKINDIKIKMSSFKEDPVDLEKVQKDLSHLITGLAVMILQDKNKNFVGLEDRLKFLNNMKTFFGDRVNKTERDTLIREIPLDKKRKSKIAKEFNILAKESKKEKDIPTKKRKIVEANEVKKKHAALDKEIKLKERKLHEAEINHPPTKVLWTNDNEKRLANSIGKVFKAFNIRGIYGTEGKRKTRKKKAGRKSRKKKGGRKSRRKRRIKKRRKTNKKRGGKRKKKTRRKRRTRKRQRN